MESGIEYADHRCIGHNGFAGAYAHKVCGVVQRRKLAQAFDSFENFVSQYNR